MHFRIREAAKKVVFLVVRPLRPLPPPLRLSGRTTEEMNPFCGFLNVMKIRIIIIRIWAGIFAYIYIQSKILSSSLDTLLKVSKMTSPQKLFAYTLMCVIFFKFVSVLLTTKPGGGDAKGLSGLPTIFFCGFPYDAKNVHHKVSNSMNHYRI